MRGVIVYLGTLLVHSFTKNSFTKIMFARLKYLCVSRLWALLLCLCLMPATLCAQELDAKVTVNAQKIEGTNTAVFEALQEALKEFINTRQWTNLQFRPTNAFRVVFLSQLKNTMTQRATPLPHSWCRVQDPCITVPIRRPSLAQTTPTLALTIASLTNWSLMLT